MKRAARSSLLAALLLLIGVTAGIMSAGVAYDRAFAEAHNK